MQDLTCRAFLKLFPCHSQDLEVQASNAAETSVKLGRVLTQEAGLLDTHLLSQSGLQGKSVTFAFDEADKAEQKLSIAAGASQGRVVWGF